MISLSRKILVIHSQISKRNSIPIVDTAVQSQARCPIRLGIPAFGVVSCAGRFGLQAVDVVPTSVEHATAISVPANADDDVPLHSIAPTNPLPALTSMHGFPDQSRRAFPSRRQVPPPCCVPEHSTQPSLSSHHPPPAHVTTSNSRRGSMPPRNLRPSD